MNALRLLLVEDDEVALYGYERYFAENGYETKHARNLKEARTAVAAERFGAIILDLKLPDGDSIAWLPELKSSHPHVPVIIITGINDISIAVKAIKHGAENFLTKPVAMDDLKVILEKCIALESMRKRDHIQQRQTNQSPPYFGKSKATAEILEQARIVSASNTVVLLLGETGTGKGVLSRWIHNNSERKSEAFIEVNCSSLKGDLLRSELFGHARGSFTSAVAAKEGLIELANGGTLFLDEIGDMAIEVQTELLKAIEEKSFRRVGENLIRKSDFRLICATNSNLRADSTKFRSDLYFRISTFPISLPPLRQRKEEIPGLAEHFLTNFGYTQFPLDSEVLLKLSGYPWPGNTREFRNVLERALLLAQGKVLTPFHFPDLSEDLVYEEAQDLGNVEDAHILQLLEKFNGDKKQTCKALGLSISSLYRRLAKIKESRQEAPTKKKSAV